MKVVDIRAFSALFVARSIPCFQDQNIPGYSGPIEGIFIKKVVDIRAFSALFVAWCPVFRIRIYRGILGPLREFS